MGFPIFPLNWTDSVTGEISSGYREKGYFPEAVINFLALLGWNDGSEQELFSLEELCQKFDLNRVHKSGAKFDPEKNKWFNHQYLQQQNDENLAALFTKSLEEKGIQTNLDLKRIVGMIKERAHFVSDFWDLADYFFIAPALYEEKALKNWKNDTPALLSQAFTVLSNVEPFESLLLENELKAWMVAHEIGMGKIMQPLRLSLVGALKGPHLFDIIELLGKEEVGKRITKAIETIEINP
jgi:glutamyl-tRNA synthetase